MIKKTLISKISTRLLGLEFESDNIIKQKDIKFFVKNIAWFIVIMETYLSIMKNILQTKIQMLEKLNKID